MNRWISKLQRLVNPGNINLNRLVQIIIHLNKRESIRFYLHLDDFGKYILFKFIYNKIKIHENSCYRHNVLYIKRLYLFYKNII